MTTTAAAAVLGREGVHQVLCVWICVPAWRWL